MPFSRDDKHLIKLLRQDKHYSARYFLKEFPNRNWTLGRLNHLLKKIDNFGSIEWCAGSRRPRSAWTVANVDTVADLVQSQDDQPRSHLTVREISCKMDLPRSCVHDIVKKDLNLKCLKRKAVQELTEANKLARYERSKQLLRRYPQHAVDFIAAAVRQWRRRLSACVKVGGGHFEHCF